MSRCESRASESLMLDILELWTIDGHGLLNKAGLTCSICERKSFYVSLIGASLIDDLSKVGRISFHNEPCHSLVHCVTCLSYDLLLKELNPTDVYHLCDDIRDAIDVKRRNAYNEDCCKPKEYV